MNFARKITEFRKQKWCGQNELAKKQEVSEEIDGRCERHETLLSIEIAKRRADIPKMSLNYMMGSMELDKGKSSLVPASENQVVL